MNLVLTVLEIVAPVFLLALVGFVWTKLGFEYRVQFVTRLTMTLAAPCLIFTALMKTDIEPQAMTRVSLAAVVAYGVVSVVVFAVIKVARLDSRTYLAPLIFGNTGNIGLPLALFAFGEAGLSLAVVVFAVMAMISYTIGIIMVSGHAAPTMLLKEPLAWATALGGIFLWNGWETPRALTRTMDLAGQMMIPMMLITLGVAVARLKPAGVGRAVVMSVLKLGLTAGVAWAVGQWFALDPVALAVLVLQLATPVAVTSYLLAEKYQAGADAVAGLVVVSTALSVATLPLLLALLL